MFDPWVSCSKVSRMQLTIEIPDELAHKAAAERERLSNLVERALRLPASNDQGIVQEVFGFLSRDPSPEEVIGFRPSEKSIVRLQELLDKNRESSLTASEEVELDTMQSLNHLFALLKLQARQQIVPAA